MKQQLIKWLTRPSKHQTWETGHERIVTIWNALKWKAVDLPGLDGSVDPQGRVNVFIYPSGPITARLNALHNAIINFLYKVGFYR